MVVQNGQEVYKLKNNFYFIYDAWHLVNSTDTNPDNMYNYALPRKAYCGGNNLDGSQIEEYLTLPVGWAFIQFKSYTNGTKIAIRSKWGRSSWTDWKQIY